MRTSPKDLGATTDFILDVNREAAGKWLNYGCLRTVFNKMTGTPKFRELVELGSGALLFPDVAKPARQVRQHGVGGLSPKGRRNLFAGVALVSQPPS